MHSADANAQLWSSPVTVAMQISSYLSLAEVNEPDIGGPMWQGTLQQYLDLYRVSVTAIKDYNPELKVSGQVCNCGGQYAKSLLAYCREQKLPMDFFSWHCYSNSPGGLSREARSARSLLDANGFTNAASMCTEWRPMLAGFGEVAWSPNQPSGSVRAAFDRNRNHEAAAFAASALMQAQDAPLDMAHFYTADSSPWSMFDEYGVPGKVFFRLQGVPSIVADAQSGERHRPAGCGCVDASRRSF